jgi:hypothetical protein
MQKRYKDTPQYINNNDIRITIVPETTDKAMTKMGIEAQTSHMTKLATLQTNITSTAKEMITETMT